MTNDLVEKMPLIVCVRHALRIFLFLFWNFRTNRSELAVKHVFFERMMKSQILFCWMDGRQMKGEHKQWLRLKLFQFEQQLQNEHGTHATST